MCPNALAGLIIGRYPSLSIQKNSVHGHLVLGSGWIAFGRGMAAGRVRFERWGDARNLVGPEGPRRAQTSLSHHIGGSNSGYGLALALAGPPRSPGTPGSNRNTPLVASIVLVVLGAGRSSPSAKRPVFGEVSRRFWRINRADVGLIADERQAGKVPVKGGRAMACAIWARKIRGTNAALSGLAISGGPPFRGGPAGASRPA